MKECCKKQYLVWGETGYLTCLNCGAEDTGEIELTEEDFRIQCEKHGIQFVDKYGNCPLCESVEYEGLLK